ncbi:MAG: hypothetical protein HY869_15465 [Chloroflexi bacterium]|nr:hypothetical protein [Chloroflexota bacterium]
MNEYLFIALEELSKRPVFLPANWDEEKYLRASRGFGRIFLGLLSILTVAAGGILWFVTPFERLQGSPLWMPAIVLLGFLCLFLVFRNRPGDMRLLFLCSIPLATSFAMNLWSNFSVKNTNNNIYVFVLIFGTFLLPVLFFLFTVSIQPLDPLPIESSLLPLFYPVRFRHLRRLREFSQARGWTVHGLNGFSHRLIITGHWQGCKITLVSLRISNKLPKHLKRRNFVDITLYCGKHLTPLELKPRTKQNINESELFIKGFRDEYLLCNYSSQQVSANSINLLKSTLSEGGKFLRKSSVLGTVEGALLFRCYDLKLLEDINMLHDLLTWLEKITATMKLQNFYIEEALQKFED